MLEAGRKHCLSLIPDLPALVKAAEIVSGNNWMKAFLATHWETIKRVEAAEWRDMHWSIGVASDLTVQNCYCFLGLAILKSKGLNIAPAPECQALREWFSQGGERLRQAFNHIVSQPELRKSLPDDIEPQKDKYFVKLVPAYDETGAP